MDDADAIVELQRKVAARTRGNPPDLDAALGEQRDLDYGALADEAERGYDVAHLAGKPSRRPPGAKVLEVSVRFDEELLTTALARAEVERTSLNEVLRQALREYLAGPSS